MHSRKVARDTPGFFAGLFSFVSPPTQLVVVVVVVAIVAVVWVMMTFYYRLLLYSLNPLHIDWRDGHCFLVEATRDYCMASIRNSILQLFIYHGFLFDGLVLFYCVCLFLSIASACHDMAWSLHACLRSCRAQKGFENGQLYHRSLH